jgi:hypothetical protein
MLTESFPFNYVKIQIIFEPPFWICKWANHLSFLAMSLSTKLSTKSGVGKINGTAITNRLQNSFIIKDNNVHSPFDQPKTGLKN